MTLVDEFSRECLSVDVERRLTSEDVKRAHRVMPSDHCTELVLDALEMALFRRRPSGVVHHSDQGCQYTSIAFGKRCEEAGVHPSMGSVGDCYDNAMAESFFATLECELLERRPLATSSETRRAVFEWIEGWYNPHRRHSSLDQQSPNVRRR